MNRCDEVWATCAFNAWVYKEQGVTRPIRIYKHGLHDVWKNSTKRTVGSKFRFLHIGEPSERKGGSLTVKTFIETFGNNPDVELTVKCHETSTIRVYDMFGERVDFSKYPNIKFVSKEMSDEELVMLMHSHHCLIYPSYGEGFGFIPIQAMATGMPVICTEAWAPYKEFADADENFKKTGYNSSGTINKSFILTASPATTLGNWQELLTPTDSVLSVDGLTGAVSLSGTYLNSTTGTLLGNLAAGGFKITGLGTPTSDADSATKAYVDTVAGSATAAAASAAAAAASYDSFDDRYLGSKSTAPTVDNDGNTLLTGAIYWNSSTNAMYAWTGTEWGSISSTADIYRFRFTATGGETTISGTDDNGLTLAYIPGKEQVYLNGVLLARTSDYTASNGSSITSLAALAASDIVEIITFTAFELADSIARSLFDAKGDILVATSADTPGKLALGTNGYYLKANSATATGLEWAAVPNPDLTPYATITSVNATNEDQNIMSIMGAY